MSYIINNKKLEDEVANHQKVEWMEDWRSSQEWASWPRARTCSPEEYMHYQEQFELDGSG
jgi:hypothetical protein